MGQDRGLCTPATAAKILDYLRRGNYIETAASRGGVTPRTVQHWLKRAGEEERRIELGAEPDPNEAPYVAFAKEVDAAHAEAETTLLDRIADSARGDWKAAAWLMERRYRKRWGANVNVTIEAELEKTLRRIEKALPREVFETVLAVMATDDEPEET